MKKNMGQIDKTIRIALGLVLIGAGIYFGSWWGAVGIIPLATAFINWCPLYVPFGISTCKLKENN
ncbi:MAG: DUF2892 domain-containing protein [Bacteroidetes bacterium]|nr:DUF2892 domain-containing protein [Bacteroidota bacterium]MBU1679220.1 DUF2892 domain-containing protein [Bacteroidota bacterium]